MERLPDDVPDAPGIADVPDVPDEVREASRLAPDHWIGVVDPAWPADDDPASWAITGWWRTDSEGEVVEWADNAEYRPSPTALGWDEPVDELDAAVQLAATGYGPREDVERLLATTEVVVLVDAADAPVTAQAPDGTPVVPVFSSPAHVAKMGALAHRLTSAADLLQAIPDTHRLYLNPAGPVAFVVDHDALSEALSEALSDALTEKLPDRQ